jgi:TolB-like protein
MSPEQASGQRADERSDVWALGVILFEMLAATRPFAAHDPRAAIHMILTSEPDLRAQRPDLAAGITELVHAALSKDPATRFADGSEFLEALRTCRSRSAIPVPRRGTRRLRNLHSRTAGRGLLAALAIVATVVTTRTFLPEALVEAERNLRVGVAIAPFVDGDAGFELAEFGRDLAERVGATLALVPDLDVIPDRSPSSFTAAAGMQPDRGRQVVRAVDGALYRKGERVLVTVRLLDGSTGDSLWTGSWERAGADQAALLDELSLVIADAMRLHIVPYQPKTYTESRRAYDRFLQGVYAHRRYTSGDIWTALQFYREAYEEDPTFALAHAIAGNAYIDLTNLGLSEEIGLEMAREHVHEALDLDSTLAEAHAALGFLQIWGDQDFEAGERSLRRSIMLYPTLPQARAWYGYYALFVRDWRDAALANVRRALEVDPLNTVRSHAIEQQLYRARRYDEVLEQHRVTWSLDRDVARSLPDSPLAEAYREMGRYDESIAEFRALQERTGAPPAAGLAVTYARMGREPEARAILHEVETRAMEADDLAIAVGRIYANLGDFDMAFQWLERAYESRRYTILSIRSDPALDPLRDDPRFAELLRRVGLSPA